VQSSTAVDAKRLAAPTRACLQFALLALIGVAISVSASAVAAARPLQTQRAATGNTRAHGADTAGGLQAPSVPSAAQPPSFAVGMRVLRLIDPSRRIHLPHGRSGPRTLVTYVRYPALGAPGETDLRNAPAARSGGPFPLVVFGHGFAVTPATYAHLLQALAGAGYVVAAPVFPLENANAPGGPDESDLVNQPRDMSVVISRLLAASAAGADPLAGVVDPAHVAVAGQSDGGETALAVAYGRRLRDARVSAAVILSGAEMSGVGGFGFTRASPPLLAAQGTADTTNQPKFTYAFFNAARRPKYLLRLLGARHLPPYTREQPQLAIVEGVTIAFLDRYLKRSASSPQRLVSLGSVPGTAAVTADA
jgi:predicted dienelactone hydrolase